jgi:hypothetical protein
MEKAQQLIEQLTQILQDWKRTRDSGEITIVVTDGVASGLRIVVDRKLTAPGRPFRGRLIEHR